MRNKSAKVSDPNAFVTDPGSSKHIIYSPVVDSNGDILLVESGYDDIQDFIDSFRGQCDMSYIVSRLNAGDLSVLAQSEGMYGDFTNVPKSYAEALQLVIDAEKKFNSLPLEVRNSFDNSYTKWFATAGNEVWLEKMAPVLPHDDDMKEVIADES